MRIPRFWASAESPNPLGWDGVLKCFGHSDRDVEEARSRAKEAVARLAAHLKGENEFPDKYAYSDRPIREEILDEVKDSSGAVIALVTRNGYGAEVLNAAGVLFADIDDPPAKGAGLFASLARLFGSRKPETPAPTIPPAVTRYAEAHPDVGLRVYRTRAGWRVILVNEEFDPTSPKARETLVALESDPQYVELTRVQQCFRARLTPKPWRCGIPRPLRNFPRENAAVEKVHQEWLRKYQSSSGGFATCRLVTELGRGRDTAAASTIISLHDRATRATSGLPLA